jgi:hypothetical protein
VISHSATRTSRGASTLKPEIRSTWLNRTECPGNKGTRMQPTEHSLFRRDSEVKLSKLSIR